MNSHQCIIIIFFVLIGGCGKKYKDQGVYSQFPNDGTGLPLPRFDKDFGELLVSLEEEFNAENVQISRPFDFNSVNKPEHWLKVSLLNPEMLQVGDDPFAPFAERVAESTYQHLTNCDKFNKIEISVEYDIEQLLGFNSVISKFLWRDSLKSNSLKSHESRR